MTERDAGRAEPVAWRWCERPHDIWRVTDIKPFSKAGRLIEPLYAAAPVAGRAETIEECANNLSLWYPDHAMTNAYCAALRSMKSEPPHGPSLPTQPALEPSTAEILTLAENIIEHDDNITYPSRQSSQHVRKVMRSLVEAFRDMETRALHAETILAEQDAAS